MHFPANYPKNSEITSNRTADQEMSVLCLHLLQSSLVFINTLMIQRVLNTEEWQDRLTPEDIRGLTPLIYSHVNPYGTFELNMDKRMELSA